MVPPTNFDPARWQARLAELEALAGPLLRSPAVQRLRTVTLLGILSPQLRRLSGCPLWQNDSFAGVDDGSRFDHTIGVAAIALDTARRFGLSPSGQRYAVAWGLTHDLATWPLAHTSEPAFAAILGVTSTSH
jgi:HD superfamily phosphohydrolase